MTEELWNNILHEADKNNDGKIDYNEFESAMKEVFRKSWLRKCDQSPSKSMSPVRQFDLNSVDLSPVKFNGQNTYQSPMKKRKRFEDEYNNGKIISPERNPFAEASPEIIIKKSPIESPFKNTHKHNEIENNQTTTQSSKCQFNLI